MKPRCGTCLWFERSGDKGQGLCMFAPPVIQVVMPPPSQVMGKLIQSQPQVQGLRPPTGENDRCHQWQTAIAETSSLKALTHGG